MLFSRQVEGAVDEMVIGQQTRLRCGTLLGSAMEIAKTVQRVQVLGGAQRVQVLGVLTSGCNVW